MVGAALAGAATAAFALPGLGGAVVRTVRTGLCIVGGDVCRSADAAAAGLAPCVTGERTARQETTLDLAVAAARRQRRVADRAAVRRRRDVTRLEETDAGGVIGVGAELGAARGVGRDAPRVARYRGGKAWTFADARAAAAFLDGAMHDAAVQDARAPDVRWIALEGDASGEAGVALAELAGAGLAIGGEQRDRAAARGRAAHAHARPRARRARSWPGHLPGFPRPARGRAERSSRT